MSVPAREIYLERLIKFDRNFSIWLFRILTQFEKGVTKKRLVVQVAAFSQLQIDRIWKWPGCGPRPWHVHFSATIYLSNNSSYDRGACDYRQSTCSNLCACLRYVVDISLRSQSGDKNVRYRKILPRCERGCFVVRQSSGKDLRIQGNVVIFTRYRLSFFSFF